MASSEDFKKQLKAGKIVEALTMALSQAVELEITTWVASSSDSDVEAPSSGAKLAKPGHRLRTRISLLEGKIENEIGNQFIGSGPFKDLRQFHQQQVTDSHNIIQNNLNSLQKLFGLLVAMRHSNPDAPAIDPESPVDIGPILPPVDNPETPPGLPESTVEVSVPSPVIPEASNLGMKEDWEDLVLDESSPATPATSLQVSSQRTDEGWEDLVVEELFQGAPAPSQSSLDVGTDEDWGEEQPSPVTPATSLEASSLGLDEDWGDLVEDELSPPAPSQSSLDLGTDEDWEDWEESSQTAPSQSSLDVGTDEDWEDWGEEQSSQLAPAHSEAPSQPERTPSTSPLNLATDEEWEELSVDEPEPFAAVPAANGFSLAAGIEEHWEEFEVEELGSHPATSQAISPQPTLAPANEDFEDLNALADLISLESELNENSDYELLIEDFEEESFAQTSPPRNQGIHSATASDDSLADLFGESSLSEQRFHETSFQSSPASADRTPATQTPAPESYSIEDALFLELEESSPTGSLSEDTISSLDDADLLAAFDEDELTNHLTPANEPSVHITPPPPPPQNQSKNQSNEKQGG